MKKEKKGKQETERGIEKERKRWEWKRKLSKVIYTKLTKSYKVKKQTHMD